MWYLLARIDGRDVLQGPYSEAEIAARINRGDITENTPISFGSNSAWKNASHFDNLKPYLRQFQRQRLRSPHLPEVDNLVEAVDNNFPGSPCPTQETPGLVPGTVLAEKTPAGQGVNPPGKVLANLDIVRHKLSSRKEGKRGKAAIGKVTAFILLILFALLFRQTVTKESPVPPPVSVVAMRNPLPDQVTREEIVEETNSARQEKGLPPLLMNDLLSRIAAERMEDMFQKQYFGHISPAGEGAGEIAERVGYRYRRLAENIGSIGPYATGRKFVNGWMQSPGHQRNILDREVKEIGVAVRKDFFQGEKAWVSVQIFGLQSPPLTDETGSATDH